VGQRAVITGATGFIGWHVAERLRDAGWTVCGTVRPGRPRSLPVGVEPAPVSLTDAAISHVLRGADVVIHLAGLTQAPTRRRFDTVNVAATEVVARATRRSDAHFIHISSLAAAGPAPRHAPRREEDEPYPITPYGASKLASERVVRGIDGLRWTILRPGSVYGPRDRNFLTLFRLAARGFFFSTSRTAAYTLIHVHDVVAAIEATASRPVSSQDVFFVGHPAACSEPEMWRVLARIFGRVYRPFMIPRPVLWSWALIGEASAWMGLPSPMTFSRLRELDAGGFVCRVEKAAEQLGFRAAVGFEDGFETTALWYREQRWLG